MAEHSAIEWTDATWNPVTGCSVVSPGCTNCYAMKLAGTRLSQHASRAGLTRVTKAGPVWTGEVRFNREWLLQPIHWRKPRRIFVCAHGDLFHESVPDDWIDQVFDIMARARMHTFQILTKRAERMRNYMAGVDAGRFVAFHAQRVPYRLGIPELGILPATPIWPLPNVWLGVSAEDQARADQRVPHLLATPAAVRFVSAEPLLGPIDLSRIVEGESEWYLDALRGDAWDDVNGSLTGEYRETFGSARLDWVIVGGESGAGARPMHPAWVRSIRDQCAAANVPFFFKQWGEWSPHTAALEDADGSISTTPRGGCNWQAERPGGWFGVFRVGKKAAGRLLDGVEHNGMPEARP